MAEGWICLHRKMLDNGTVCRDAAHMAIWVYLLLSAEHEETEVLFGGERRVLKAGELMISVNKFAETYGIEKNKTCLLYTSPSPRDQNRSRMPSSA